MIKRVIAILIFIFFLAAAALPLPPFPGPNPEGSAEDNSEYNAISMRESQDTGKEDEQEELEDINKLDLDNMTLADLVKLPVRPRSPLLNYWETLNRLVLRIYGENINFPHHKKKIRIGTDSDKFRSRLYLIERTIHRKEIEAFLIEPGDPVDEDFDFVFLESKKLAKQYAATGKVLVFSNKKSCRYAAFVISLSSTNKLKVHFREKRIDTQGANYSNDFLDSLRRKRKKK